MDKNINAFKFDSEQTVEIGLKTAANVSRYVEGG
jgi:hypothetical protein